MSLNDIDSTKVTDLDTETTQYAAGHEPWQKNLDGFNLEEKDTETIEYVPDWPKWHGRYRSILELKKTIDLQARWVVSKEIKYKNNAQKNQIEKIKGNGKSSIRKILINLKRTAKICGDAFAEIIRDKAGRVINLKPINPGNMKIIGNRRGIIKEYQQVLVKQNDQGNKKIEPIGEKISPDKILHISNDPVADEIHGIPESEAMTAVIKMRHQTMMDWQTIIHRYMKPTYFYEVDTDNETEMQEIKEKIEKSTTNFENVVFPKGTLDKVIETRTASQGTLDPLPWLRMLKTYFTMNSGVPDIVQGESRESAVASANINYIGFKEKIIFEQLEFSEDLKVQLGWEIEFENPREITHEITDPAEGNEEGTKQPKETNPNRKAKENQEKGENGST